MPGNPFVLIAISRLILLHSILNKESVFPLNVNANAGETTIAIESPQMPNTWHGGSILSGEAARTLTTEANA